MKNRAKIRFYTQILLKMLLNRFRIKLLIVFSHLIRLVYHVKGGESDAPRCTESKRKLKS